MVRSRVDKVILVRVLLMLVSCSGKSIKSQSQKFNHRVDIENMIQPDIDEKLGKQSGIKVSRWNPNSTVNPEELGEYLEGDIIVSDAMKRNGIKAESNRWPGGVIPFLLSPFFGKEELLVIRSAMAEFHENTCIKFKQYEGEESDYIRIGAGETGCWSAVGRIGGPQMLNLQVPGCLSRKGTVIHELMHVIGFFHEHSRTERDQFINVIWNNIKPGVEGNFEKYGDRTADGLGVRYDYDSVMHYSSHAFSRNGKPTIMTNDKGSSTSIGQRKGLSSNDIEKVRRMYKCKEQKRNNIKK